MQAFEPTLQAKHGAAQRAPAPAPPAPLDPATALDLLAVSAAPRDSAQQVPVPQSTLSRALAATVARRTTGTDLPDGLRGGLEHLSGLAMDDVRVYYDSPEPARFDATAYACGSDIHLAPGREEDLPHEAWHVVQQRSGRVAPTAHEHTVAINDDIRLELEAEMMGARALAASGPAAPARPHRREPATPVLQPNGMFVRLLRRPAVEIHQFIARMNPKTLTRFRSSMLNHLASGDDPNLKNVPLAKRGVLFPHLMGLAALIMTLRREQQMIVYDQLAEAFGSVTTNRTLTRMLERRKSLRLIDQSDLESFVATFGYAKSKDVYLHKLFGHDTLTLYPMQKEPGVLESQGSLRKVVHRPILEVERVGNTWYARCYLGLLAKSTSPTHKDITANDDGEIVFTHILLMNIGNPMKALLWCEDYLTSKEHDAFEADPVIRSFLVPLTDVERIFKKEGGARPLDQDRGSGQFGSTGTSDESSGYMGGKMHPLKGSLVSFFLNPSEYATQLEGQKKLPMSLLQHYLTGHAGDPREMTKSGVAAQHGRKGHEAAWEDDYRDVMMAYYTGVATNETGFGDATQEGESAKRGKYAKGRVPPAPVEYPF